MKQEDVYRQHGSVTCYQHSVAVTLMSVRLARSMRLKVDMESMIKGALLHDYFLYDWRSDDNDITRRHHGFNHAEYALENACRDFSLSPVACDVIKKHMFPLNICPPKYKESYVVSVADKIIATKEVCRFVKNKMKRGMDRSVSYVRRRKAASA
ncbi:MAG: HD domain-containing protein [Firmicutes bacterium]|nr:HD domain-containing protein [Bacillota bacterium]